MGPTPVALIHWMHKETQTGRHKSEILLLSALAKLKVKGNTGLDVDISRGSDFSE